MVVAGGRVDGGRVDTTDVALIFGADGHLRPGAGGCPLRDLVRRDVRKLMDLLVSIDIRWVKIGDTMAKELADLLRKCPSVTSLDVQDNFITCIGCMELARALSTPQTRVASLNLSGNRVADLGAATVSSMLLANSSLTHLDLSGNRLERQAMEGIGGGLRGNTTLKTLLLDENFFGDEGANELGWAITYNSTLRTVSLRGNVCCPPRLPDCLSLRVRSALRDGASLPVFDVAAGSTHLTVPLLKRDTAPTALRSP